MLDPAELAAVAEQFGVADEQVRRDHMVSHLLGALARDAVGQVVFFGGTALARTHLPDGRLSEDLDLLAVGRRRDVVAEVERVLTSGAQREIGRLRWDPPLSAVRDVEPAVLRDRGGLAVRVQLLDALGLPRWPTERRPLHQRHADAPPAELRVPTLPAFAASKTVAWFDRRAPRDLYDLWGTARLGAIDAAASRLFVTHGPTGGPPQRWMFSEPPTESAWLAELGGQTRVAVSAQEALVAVRERWAAASA